MKDDEDNRTLDIPTFLGGADEKGREPSSTVADGLVSPDPVGDMLDQASEDLHLLQDHALIKTVAYIRDPDQAAKKRSAAAERMQRMRERKREAGLVTVEVPAEVAQRLQAGEVPAPAPAPAVALPGGWRGRLLRWLLRLLGARL